MTTIRQANAQIRRLRAGLIEARDTLRDHFGPEDASVVAAERALAGEPAPLERASPLEQLFFEITGRQL